MCERRIQSPTGLAGGYYLRRTLGNERNNRKRTKILMLKLGLKSRARGCSKRSEERRVGKECLL